MKRCYLCNSVLVDAQGQRTTLDHDEHIIPNAIGGQLKARGILCSPCGGLLGDSIDGPFAAMFQLITHRIDMRRDRNTSAAPLHAKLTLHATGEAIEVALRNSKLVYRKPSYAIDHKRKLVQVFGAPEVVKYYKAKAEKEVMQMLGENHGYRMELVSDINSHPEFKGTIEFPFTLDNDLFEAGFAKIAIEYALYNGIEHEQLAHLIDTETRTIKYTGTTIPYYPIHDAEKTFEEFRSAVDADLMSHSVVLFSQKQVENDVETKRLFCFIELFGTFQYYVLLSDNYTGADVEPLPYTQRLIRQPSMEEDFSKVSIKDLSISIRELGIDDSQLEDKSMEELRRYVQQVYDSRNRYVFDYTDYAKKIVDGILWNAIFERDPRHYEKMMELLAHFFRDVEKDEFHIQLFRTRVIRKGEFYSIIPEIIDLYETDRNAFNSYTFAKFSSLERFINANANH